MIINIGGKGGSSFAIPTYTGSFALFGDEREGWMELYSSGTLTLNRSGTVDVFLLGSGLRGATGTASGSGSTVDGSGTATGGKGGSGAVGLTLFAQKLDAGSYDIVVGAACSSTSKPNATAAFGSTANTVRANGGKGGYATASWSGYSMTGSSSTPGSTGSNGSSVPFDVTSGDLYRLLGAGGGGGGGRASGFAYQGGYAGGILGGGNGGSYSGGAQINLTPGTANTGSGGGGGGAAAYGSSLSKFAGGNGGSGLVIIRWGA